MKKYLIISVLAVAALLMIWDSVKQPGTEDLKGDFKELAFIRNEQNTGPVVRIYAASVTDTLWTEMESYGRLMPHTKYGVTRVYFFRAGQPVPDRLTLEGSQVPERFQANCLAAYEKNAMGQVHLTRLPFGNK
ncbi:MAG TPA: hypothetical protein VGE15_11080 [Sphingobacteriaceae bacterium]